MHSQRHSTSTHHRKINCKEFIGWWQLFYYNYCLATTKWETNIDWRIFQIKTILHLLDCWHKCVFETLHQLEIVHLFSRCTVAQAWVRVVPTSDYTVEQRAITQSGGPVVHAGRDRVIRPRTGSVPHLYSVLGYRGNMLPRSFSTLFRFFGNLVHTILPSARQSL